MQYERNPKSEKTMIVPIRIENLDKSHIAELSVNEASVTITGDKSTIDSIRKDDIYTYVDVKNIQPNSEPVNLKISTVINGINPSRINITTTPTSLIARIDAVSEKRLTVDTKFVSAAPLGYTYSDPIIDPPSVVVSGKSQDVVRVKRAVVTIEPMDNITSLDEYLTVVPLDANGNRVRNVQLSHDKVSVKLSLIDVPATKSVIVSPNLTGSPKYPAKVTSVSVNPSSVTLEGKPSSLVPVSTVSTQQISIDGAESSFTKEVQLISPPDLNIIGNKSVTVTVNISKND
ncbi:MAG: CdaR family protein [Armatimonadota bacterium]